MPVNTLQKRFRISPTAVFLFGNIYPLALFNKDLGSLQRVLLSGNICPFHIKTWDLSNYSLTLWQHLPVSTFLFTERLHLSQWNDTFWQSVTFTLSLAQKDVTSENKLWQNVMLNVLIFSGKLRRHFQTGLLSLRTGEQTASGLIERPGSVPTKYQRQQHHDPIERQRRSYHTGTMQRNDSCFPTYLVNGHAVCSDSTMTIPVFQPTW